VAGNPILIGPKVERDIPTPIERGECSKSRTEGCSICRVYPSLSSYLAMTDFNLGTMSDSDCAPTGRLYTLLHSGGLHVPPVGYRGCTRSTTTLRGLRAEWRRDTHISYVPYMCSM
jgi:hypothetical protein